MFGFISDHGTSISFFRQILSYLTMDDIININMYINHINLARMSMTEHGLWLRSFNLVLNRDDLQCVLYVASCISNF